MPSFSAVRDLRFVQRETVLLIVLLAIAIAAFLGTRAIAVASRATHRADAAYWFALGQRELERGAPMAAIAHLRRAVLLNRGERSYRVTLAAALTATHDVDAARRILLDLRGESPEDPSVNLQLARLEAAYGDEPDAIRYYQSAIVELWTSDRVPQRRSARRELILYLLRQHQDARALAEAVIYTAGAPDDPGAHIDAGQLLLRCGSPSRALDQFKAALWAAPNDAEALAGAGEAAFAAGDYDSARTYLQQAPRGAKVDELRAVADQMFVTDPLLPHLRGSARSRRIAEAVRTLRGEIDECHPSDPTIVAAADDLGRQLEVRHGSEDTLGADLATIARLAREKAVACGTTSFDRAVLLIAQRHGVDHP